MKVSIRELLALTFLVVLAMLVWRTSRERVRDQERLARLHSEVADLEAQVALNGPDLRQALLRTHDQYRPVHAMRERAEEHFDVLREKYSSIEPPGADILALRTIPSLQTGEHPAPVVFRLWVPEEREIWLKFGVHLVQRNVQSSRESDKVDDLLSESPFEHSGPFELRLPAGDQRLEVVTGVVQEDSLPVAITLNEKVLLRSAFVWPQARGANASYISGREQIDFQPQRPLPWLLTARMNLDDRTTSEDQATTHAFSLWLSDHPSQFAEFPGDTARAERQP